MPNLGINIPTASWLFTLFWQITLPHVKPEESGYKKAESNVMLLELLRKFILRRKTYYAGTLFVARIEYFIPAATGVSVRIFSYDENIFQNSNRITRVNDNVRPGI